MNSSSDIELYKIPGWSVVTEFAVGGLEWVGFSKKQLGKLLCISSQYTSLVDCDTGEILECEADFDEKEYIAYSAAFSDEVMDIYGQYGGRTVLQTQAGEEIIIVKQQDLFSNKTVVRQKVFFNSLGQKIEIHNGYGFYTCSFSTCGNYFVFTSDAGIVILKRI